MVGRVGVEPVELFGVFGGAVLRDPEFRDQEILVAQHVEQRDLADHGAEQVRTLRDHRAHQQAAIRSALDGEVIFVGDLVGDQEFGGGDEVVENILLFVQHAGAMPVFAELGAAAQVGHGVDAAMLQPEISVRRKSWASGSR